METQTPGRVRRDAPRGAVEGGRRVELDWLRTIVVLGTIPFHAVPVIGAEQTAFILSAESNPTLAILAGFILSWGIPLLFLLSGAATGLALTTRSPGAYAWERILRLGAPMLLMLLLFSPLQLYFILLSNPSLIQLVPRYGVTLDIPDPQRLSEIDYFFEQYYRFLATSVRGYTPALGSFLLTHLWFVPRLLIVSFVSLPLLVYLRGRGRPLVERVTAFAARPVALLLVGGLAPATLVTLLQPGWLGGMTAGWPFRDDWAAFFLDLVMFLYGFLLYASGERLRDLVRRAPYPALALSALCWAGIGVMLVTGSATTVDFSPAALLFAVAQTFGVWLLVLAMLGLAMRYLTVSTAWQRYLTAAAFPVFVLHGPLLTASAYYLLQLPTPGIMQLPLIFVATVASAFALYEVIRRTPVVRVLFGVTAPASSRL